MVNQNTFKLRQEDELLLCCARTKIKPETKENISNLLNEDLDWQYLLQMASRHRLKPLLYYNLNSICPELVPEDILAELKDYFNSNVRKNLLLTGELIKIWELLKSEDISGIPYKGPSLAVLAYNDLKLREFNDLDIFVHKKHNQEVFKLMVSLGYILESYPHTMDIDLYFKTQTEHKFVNKDKKIVVEIHNKFQGHFFSFPINPRFLYENDTLQTLIFNNFQINTLSNENLILMLCVHCARHNWSKLFWICDIFELIESYGIKWEMLIKTAESLSIKRILLVNLKLASDFFGLDLPNEIRNSIECDHNVVNIYLKLKIKLFSRKIEHLNLFDRILLDLKKRESLKMSLIDVFNSIFKPTYADFEELPLPKYFFIFYYVIRPFLLIRRY